MGTEKFSKGYIRDRELGGPHGPRGGKRAADFSLDIRHFLIRRPETVPLSPASLSKGTIRALWSSGLKVILLGGEQSLELLRCLEIEDIREEGDVQRRSS